MSLFVTWPFLHLLLTMVVSIGASPLMDTTRMKFIIDRMFHHREFIDQYPKLYLIVVGHHFGVTNFTSQECNLCHQTPKLLLRLLHELNLFPENLKLEIDVSMKSLKMFNLTSNELGIHRKMISIPRPLIKLFKDEPNFNTATSNIAYHHLIESMQTLVNNNSYEITKGRFALWKKNKFMALFRLTVMRTFVQKVNKIISLEYAKSTEQVKTEAMPPRHKRSAADDETTTKVNKILRIRAKLHEWAEWFREIIRTVWQYIWIFSIVAFILYICCWTCCFALRNCTYLRFVC